MRNNKYVYDLSPDIIIRPRDPCGRDHGLVLGRWLACYRMLSLPRPEKFF